MKEEIIITSDSVNKNYIKDIWQNRELFLVLSWRDIKVRYKQTLIGAAWAVIRPVTATIIFTIVFSRIAGIAYAGAAPYAIMVYAGMLAWQFFSQVVSEGAESIVGQSALITKVYFPRVIVPAGVIGTALVDFLISLALFVVLCFWFGFNPGINVLLLPLWLFELILLALGTALMLAAANIYYRDVRYIIPFALQVGLYISPVGFSMLSMPDKWKDWIICNPLSGIINGFRFALVREPLACYPQLYSLAFSILMITIGFMLFRKVESKLADRI